MAGPMILGSTTAPPSLSGRDVEDQRRGHETDLRVRQLRLAFGMPDGGSARRDGALMTASSGS